MNINQMVLREKASGGRRESCDDIQVKLSPAALADGFLSSLR